MNRGTRAMNRGATAMNRYSLIHASPAEISAAMARYLLFAALFCLATVGNAHKALAQAAASTAQRLPAQPSERHSATSAADGKGLGQTTNQTPDKLKLPSINLPEDLPQPDELGLDESMVLQGTTDHPVVEGDLPPNADRTRPADVEATIRSVQEQRRRRIERLQRQLKLFDRVMEVRGKAPIPGKDIGDSAENHEHDAETHAKTEGSILHSNKEVPSPASGLANKSPSNPADGPSLHGLGPAHETASGHENTQQPTNTGSSHGNAAPGVKKANELVITKRRQTQGEDAFPHFDRNTANDLPGMHGLPHSGEASSHSGTPQNDDWAKLKQQVQKTPFGEQSMDRPALADNLFALDMISEASQIYEALAKKAKLNDPNRTWYSYQAAASKRRLNDWEGAIKGWREVVISYQRGELTDISKWWLDRAAAIQSITQQSANFSARLDEIEKELMDETTK